MWVQMHKTTSTMCTHKDRNMYTGTHSFRQIYKAVHMPDSTNLIVEMGTHAQPSFPLTIIHKWMYKCPCVCISIFVPLHHSLDLRITAIQFDRLCFISKNQHQNSHHYATWLWLFIAPAPLIWWCLNCFSIHM